jgi:peptidoglycan/xylan/chitin deacetylase (PgdA/CDA1 family)
VISVTFDNLGEVSALERGQWPAGEPLGHHYSVTRSLPRILELLDDAGLRATFFVEGLNTELYPDTLRELDAAGHEVAYHGWRHEPWAGLEPAAERESLERGVAAMERLGVRPVGFRPPGGELTPATPDLLRELGFTYCSPEAGAAEALGGLAVLPFRWPLVDAFHYLPHFAELRERYLATGELQPPSRLRAEIEAALGGDGFVALLFHPFLLDEDAHVAVLRDALEAARGRGDAALCRDVALGTEGTAA